MAPNDDPSIWEWLSRLATLKDLLYPLIALLAVRSVRRPAVHPAVERPKTAPGASGKASLGEERFLLTVSTVCAVLIVSGFAWDVTDAGLRVGNSDPFLGIPVSVFQSLLAISLPCALALNACVGVLWWPGITDNVATEGVPEASRVTAGLIVIFLASYLLLAGSSDLSPSWLGSSHMSDFFRRVVGGGFLGLAGSVQVGVLWGLASARRGGTK